ncbi:hypothetical protein SOVF_178710, partial [Spinacia oleracea]
CSLVSNSAADACFSYCYLVGCLAVCVL